MKRKVVVGFCAAWLVATMAQAVSFVGAGYYYSRADGGYGTAMDGKLIAGVSKMGTVRTIYENFFVFDLSDVEGEILGAQLEVWNPGNGFYSQPVGSPSETFALFDVETPIADLLAGGPDLVDIFTDLGSGDKYGQYVATWADNGPIGGVGTGVTIDLNATAVSAINDARGGQFAMGGAIITIGSGNYERFLGGDPSGVTPRLVLETRAVPDYASTLTLLGMALAGVGIVRRRIAQ